MPVTQSARGGPASGAHLGPWLFGALLLGVPIPAPGAGEVADADAGAAATSVVTAAVVADVVGDDEFLSADELDLLLQDGPPAGAPGTHGDSDAPHATNWGLAPVRWGGVLSAGFRYNRADGGADHTSQLYEGRLRVNSYIMQPYIALVSGDFGLALVRSDTAGTEGAASQKLSGLAINGTGALNVFPRSRFPFQATLALSDSRTDGTLTTTDTKRRRLSLRQDYRPAVGRWRSSGQYDRSELTGSFGRDVVDRLSGDYTTHFDRQTIAVNGSWSSNRSHDGTTTDLAGVLRHSLRYREDLSFETTASYTTLDFDLERGGLGLRGDTRSAQVFTFASWTPQDSPWRGTANVRYLDNRSTFGAGGFESQNLGSSASLSYQMSHNLSLFGVLSANVSTTGARRDLTTSQTVGANYSSDAHNFGAYAYNWYGAGSLSNSTGNGGDGQRSANASVGHSLQRSWRPGALTQLRASVNQSVSTHRSSGLGSTASSTLNNSVGLALHAAPSDRISGLLSTTLSDSRTFGDDESTFQLLNTQLSGSWRIDRVSQLSSNLTWQLTRQTSSRSDSFGFATDTHSQSSSLSGNVDYMHARAFGVRNLRYTANFRANTSQSTSRRAGDPDAGRERVTLDLDQRLRYRIGRLDAELQARIGKVEGRKQGLVFLKLSRDFGAF